MKDNFKVFEEAFEEATEETVKETVESVTKNHKPELIIGGALFVGFLAGRFFGKRAGMKVSTAMLNAAREQARIGYADELLKEAMRYSVQGVFK